MDLNARVDVNCGQKDRRAENRTPISHHAEAGATKKNIYNIWVFFVYEQRYGHFYAQVT